MEGSVSIAGNARSLFALSERKMLIIALLRLTIAYSLSFSLMIVLLTEYKTKRFAKAQKELRFEILDFGLNSKKSDEW